MVCAEEKGRETRGCGLEWGVGGWTCTVLYSTGGVCADGVDVRGRIRWDVAIYALGSGPGLYCVLYGVWVCVLQ